MLVIQTTKLYEDSTVARILELTENSAMKKARAERFITRFAHYYTPIVCISALVLAILPPEYDLGGRERFDVRDFSGHEFLMPSMGFHLDILRALNRSGVTPVIRTTQVSDSVIISMVEHGLGVSVLSELVLKGRRDAVQAVPLDPPAFRSWASLPGTAGSCGPPPGASSPRPGTSFARSNRRSLC